ncbi:MAG: sulfatase family protein [Anaerolineae bacterium]
MRRNVLLVTADHMRNDALACHAAWVPPWGLAHAVQTPNLDRLAGEGVTFAQAFTPNPICVPARACITTGNYSHKCTGRKSNDGRISDDQPKLADLFTRAGYVTYAVGKLHYVPYSPPGEPRLLHGFQYAELHEEGRILNKFDPEGKLEGLEDYHDYLKSAGWGGYARAHGTGNNDVRPATSPVPVHLHEEAWVAERTIAVLQRHVQENEGKPFLLWASFSKPHPPYDPPRPYDRIYDPRQIPAPMGDWDNQELLQGRDVELRGRRTVYGWDYLSPQVVQVSRAHYAGLVTFQDAMIGRLLAWLEESGIADQTIVIYTSDHGDLLGDLGCFFKTCMFDGAVRIPMIWRVPGVTAKDGLHVRHQLVGLQDILPTLCSLTGVCLPRPVDGLDLSLVLQDANAAGRDIFVSQTHERRGGGQKYMVRTHSWKYVYCELDGTEELYDIRRIDGELTNLAMDPAYATVVQELRAYLVRWCQEHEDHDMVRDGRLAMTSASELPTLEFSANRLGWRRY